MSQVTMIFLERVDSVEDNSVVIMILSLKEIFVSTFVFRNPIIRHIFFGCVVTIIALQIHK
jgi:hypothetical protein